MEAQETLKSTQCFKEICEKNIQTQYVYMQQEQ